MICGLLLLIVIFASNFEIPASDLILESATMDRLYLTFVIWLLVLLSISNIHQPGAVNCPFFVVALYGQLNNADDIIAMLGFFFYRLPCWVYPLVLLP